MISITTPSFWRSYWKLSPEVKQRARLAYRMFELDPGHSSLRFKKLNTGGNVWSVRVGRNYRAVGERVGDAIEWYWIGSHGEFDKLFS